MRIDTITILLALCILCSGFSVAMLLVWRLLLPMRSLLIWGCGMGLYALGVLLVALRGQIADALSLPVGNLLLLLCYCCIWTGVSLYREKQPCYRTMLLLLLLFIPIFCWFTWPDPNIAVRTALVRVFMLALLAGSLSTFLRGPTGSLSTMEKAVTFAFLLDAFFRATLVVIQLVNMSHTLPLSKNMVTASSSVMSMVGMTTWGLAVIMLALEKVSAGLKTSNQNLSETLDLFDLFMRHSPIYAFIKEVTPTSSRVLQASENFEAMVGIPGSQMQGKTMQELFAAKITADDHAVVTSGSTLRLEEELNGRSYITFKFPIQRSEKRLLAGYTIDITDQKQTEQDLRKLHLQVVQQEKLASIGQLAAGVAHEINNPMGFINSNLTTLEKYVDKFDRHIQLLEALQQQSGNPEYQAQVTASRTQLKLDYVQRDVRQLITECIDGAERVMKIVRDLKNFSRSDTDECEPTDLNSCLDSTINIVSNEIKYVADLKQVYGDLPKLCCNAQQINQVALNLLINAAHAVAATYREEPGLITVTTWADQDNVWFSVSDTGCGIPAEVRSRIFEPFFTTKDVGKGTGLGLSISYEIIKKHGGELSVESLVDEGTTFTVRLPLTATPRHEDANGYHTDC